jgi:hypothetical protein
MTQELTLTCPNCGQENPTSSIHCKACGYNLRQAEGNNEQTAFVGDPTKKIKDMVEDRKAYFPRGAKLLLNLSDNATTLTADLSKNIITLGRNLEEASPMPHIDLSDYQANERGVSRLHARITRLNATLVLEDLAALNGTYVNGERISATKHYILCDGDEVRLGKFKIKVIFDRPAPPSSAV